MRRVRVISNSGYSGLIIDKLVALNPLIVIWPNHDD